MQAKVLGRDLLALFDTGAQRSVISTKVWESIPKAQRPTLRPFDRTLKTVGNHPVATELDGRPV